MQRGRAREVNERVRSLLPHFAPQLKVDISRLQMRDLLVMSSHRTGQVLLLLAPVAHQQGHHHLETACLFEFAVLTPFLSKPSLLKKAI